METTLLLGLLTGLFVASPALAASIRGYALALPPLNFEQHGQVSGFATDLLRQIAGEAGHDIQLEAMPLTRAYRTVRDTPDTVLYSIVRSPEREALFKWVGPVAPRRIMMYALASRQDVQVRQAADLRRYRHAVMKSSSAADRLRQLGLPEASLEYGQDDAMNFKKMLHGRADTVVMLDWAMHWQRRHQQVNAARIRPLWTLDQRYQYWFAFNKDTDPALLRSLQQALDRLRADGRLAALRQRYGA